MSRPEDAIYEELSRLNNELVTAQRALAQRNAELSSLTRELEARVAQRTRHLADSNDELETLAYAMAHDLRAPARHVEGLASMLMEAAVDLPVPQRAWVGMMRDASCRQAALIEHILGYLQLGSARLERQPLDMTVEVALVAKETRLAWPDVDFTWAIDELPPALGDPVLVRVILRNLLGNAAKFTSRQPSPRICVSARSERGQVVYRVADNGVGFDALHAPRMFRPFQRFHGGDFAGLGMGLAVVKRLVTRHDGQVSCESSPDGGATFAFSLGRG